MEKLVFFDYAKDIYYYEMLTDFLNDKENIYKILNYIIYNGKIYVNDGVNLCCGRKITRAKFKSDITHKLKNYNLKIQKINTSDKKVYEIFNVDQFIKIA